MRALFREMCSFYAPAKLFVFVMDGLKSKNARQRAGKDNERERDVGGGRTREKNVRWREGKEGL